MLCIACMSGVVSSGDKADTGTMDSVDTRHRITWSAALTLVVVVEVVSGEGHPQLCGDVCQLVLAAV